VGRNRVANAIAATAIVVCLGVLLSGCVATVGNIVVHVAKADKAAIKAKGKPHTGDCWQGTFKYSDGYANWGTRPPVTCSESHQLYTFAVPQLKSVHKGKLFNKKNFAYTDIVNDAYDTCEAAEELDLPALDVTVARIYLEDYLPEEQQWDAGARWVRCDVTVLALGSSVEHPEFAGLPSWSVLNRAMLHDASEFDYCVNGPTGVNSDGPKSSEALYANCDANPKWTLKEYDDIYSGPNGNYPSRTELEAQYQTSCASVYTNDRYVTYPYFPSKADWANGDEQFECWLGRRD
jgi:Septum formation